MHRGLLYSVPAGAQSLMLVWQTRTGPDRRGILGGLVLLGLVGCLKGGGPLGCAGSTSNTAPAEPTKGPSRTEVGEPAPECLAYPEAHATAPSDSRDFQAADTAFRTGLSALERGRPAEAKPHLERAVERDPTYGLAQLALADVHRELGAPARVRHDPLVHAVRLLPDNPRAHAELGMVLAALDEKEAARVHLTCALALRPGQPAARLQLAIEWLDADRPARAEDELRTLLDTEGPSVRTQVLLGRALEAQGRYEASGDAVREAARLAGGNAVLWRRAADLYRRAGQERAAETAEARADAIDPPKERRRLRPLPPARRPPGR